MGMEGLLCHGCGSSNVVYDPRGRVLICNQCGRKETYSRSTLNANEKVVSCKNNAISFFKDGKYDNAKHYALEVLNLFIDNAPSLFVMAYYEEFVSRKPGSIKDFFVKIADVPLEYEEVQDLKDLLVHVGANLGDYEIEIIKIIASNMQAEEDEEELCEFIDSFCPYLIMKRSSIFFFTDELVGYYKELASHCTIPKTCFALIKSIESNPDSPYAGDSFYLKSKTKAFYQDFVLPVGEIVMEMKNEELRNKFVGAYKNKKMKYETDADL